MLTPCFLFSGVFNPEHNSERRAMASIPVHMRSTLLEKLILTDVSLCDWSVDELRHPIIVGVHFIKTAVSFIPSYTTASPTVYTRFAVSPACSRHAFDVPAIAVCPDLLTRLTLTADGRASGLKDDSERTAPRWAQVLVRAPRATAERSRRRECHRRARRAVRWTAARRRPRGRRSHTVSALLPSILFCMDPR